MKTTQYVQFILPNQPGIDPIFERLCQEYPLHKTSHERIQRHYLDSFDWRMYQKNYVCGMDFRHQDGFFFIHEKKTGSNLCELPLKRIPRFSKEITHKTCHSLLRDILGIRALMTVASIDIDCRQLFVLNKENKTLTILKIESYTLQGQAGDNKVCDRLIIFPIRGYKKAFKHVSQYVIDHLKLTATSNELLDEVLENGSQIPRPDAFKTTQKLEGPLDTWKAARMLLRHLLDIMQMNEHGIRDAIDTEFLHDYRVAVRRTRSILGQIKHILPDKLLNHFKREFNWLGTITGPTRDLDMYLLKFEDYMQELPLSTQNELKPFRLFLERHWKAEHTRLCRTLDSKRYQKLITEWKQVLTNTATQPQGQLSKEAPPKETCNAAKPAKLVAGQRIWKLYKRALEEGMTITRESHDEDLHELRKTCKKLRYLIEFSRGFYAEKQIKTLIKSLKQLQENLGDFQDLSIQTAQLTSFAEQMQQEGLADAQTIMAMGVLIEKLNKRKAIVRENFNQRFNAFTMPDIKATFTEVFGPQRRPKENITI